MDHENELNAADLGVLPEEPATVQPENTIEEPQNDAAASYEETKAPTEETCAVTEEPATVQPDETPEQETPAGETTAEEPSAGACEASEAVTGEELLAAGDVPKEELQNAEELIHPVRKSTARLKAVVAILAVVAVLLAGATAALFALSYQMAKKLKKVDEKVDSVASSSSEPKETYVPIVIPDSTAVSSNAAVINVASACSPSVVTVKTTISTSTSSGTGSGSGVVYSEDGYIITNNHVIEDAVSVKVVFIDGTEYSATVIGTDPENDLALLRIKATGLSPVTFGNGDDIMVGELAVAIGNPLGTLANTVTDGIVSALARNISIDGVTYHVMQISCAINPGNSGGGLFNANGELIGIVNAKKQQSGIEGLAFAIPVNTVKSSIDALAAADKTTLQNSIGVTSCYEVNEETYADYNQSYLSRYEKANDNQPVYGLYVGGDGNVEYVDSKNTLMNGDVVVAVDGKSVLTVADVTEILKNKSEGDVVTLRVKRLVTSGFWGSTYSLEEKEIEVRVVSMYR